MVKSGWDVTCVVAEAVSPVRAAMGWQLPDTYEINTVVNPDRSMVQNILNHDPEHTAHIFGAMFDYSWGRYALLRAAQMGCQMGFISEAGDPDGWKAPLRRIKHAAIQKIFSHKIQFFLAMGQMGVRWFRECGHPEQKLFPFGYFVEELSMHPQREGHSIFRLIYVGSLIKRKRVDILISSIDQLKDLPVEVWIVGDGPEKEPLQLLAGSLGIAKKFKWLGIQKMKDVRDLMFQADLLVLPSRYDGWGAVVNEALMSGIPVVCTDHCGAADLLQNRMRGEVVPRNDVNAMARAIRRRIEYGPLTDEEQIMIWQWSDHISGLSAAHYFQSIINYVYGGGSPMEKPKPPWYEELSQNM